eukprot:TRINITY_DN6267_c0_g1_i2.p1 TRINITY_DN6267_c0_g1~~TRINITY_DN6267_c0_g1_i2.p1  ORF type:complete len:122 (+),score=13.55 TRINITY_DN6267_c0_g1_i2:56-421(+)
MVSELPPIHKAIRENDIEGVKKHVVEGHVNQRTACGKTPLMTAGYYCKKEILPILISAGAVVNAVDEKTGNTAAHYVVLSTVCLVVFIRFLKVWSFKPKKTNTERLCSTVRVYDGAFPGPC